MGTTGAWAAAPSLEGGVCLPELSRACGLAGAPAPVCLSLRPGSVSRSPFPVLNHQASLSWACAESPEQAGQGPPPLPALIHSPRGSVVASCWASGAGLEVNGEPGARGEQTTSWV